MSVPYPASRIPRPASRIAWCAHALSGAARAPRRLRKENASEEETRRVVTDRIQEELLRLRDTTHALIRRALGPRADAMLSPPAPPATPATPHTDTEREQ